MSIYTSFEMIRDCKADKPEGWIFFVKQFTKPCRALLAHYGGGEEALRRFITGSREALRDERPAINRELMTRWRSRLLEAAGYPRKPVGTELDLDILTEAFAELTALERQMVWFETMDYPAADAARILHVTEDAVARARDKGADMLRAKMDQWSRSLLRDCGPALGEAARKIVEAEPVPFRNYIEIVDGRLSWQLRMETERCLVASWYEVDCFCRVREADDVVSRSKELSDEEAQPYLELLHVQLPKPPFWKRVLASR